MSGHHKNHRYTFNVLIAEKERAEKERAEKERAEKERAEYTYDIDLAGFSCSATNPADVAKMISKKYAEWVSPAHEALSG